MENRKFKRLWANITLLGLVITQFSTGVFPIPIAPIDSAYASGFFIELERDDAPANQPVAPGDTIRYEITIQNDDNKLANARIINPIPPELEYVSGSNGCDYVGQTNEVICAQQPLAIGASRNVKLTFRVKNNVQNCTIIENQADVWNDDPNYPNGIPPSWSNLVETPTICPDPELTATKTVDEVTAEPGDRLEYTIEVENIGQGDADDVFVSDPIPNGLVFDAARTDSECTKSGNNIICDLGTIREGRDESVDIVFNVDPSLTHGNPPCGQSISNRADVTSSNAPNINTNTVQTSITCPVAELEIEKHVSDTTPELGDSLKFRFEITKSGNIAAHNIILRDTFPQGLRFVRSTGRNCSENGGTVVCDPFDLAANERSDEIWLEFVVESTNLCNHEASNSATIHATNISQVQSNTVYFTTECPEPDLEITKTGPSTIVAGDNITYNFTLKNTGNGVAKGVRIIDTYKNGDQRIPMPFTFLSSSGANCQYYANDHYIQCSTSDINPGSTRSFSMTFSTPAGQHCGETILNQVDANSLPYSDDIAAWDKHMVTVECDDPKLKVEKSGPSTVVAGDDITYTFTIKNTGDGVAKDVRLGDKFRDENDQVISPMPFDFISATGANCSIVDNNTKIFCSWSEIQPGETKNLTLKYKTPANQYCDKTITNKADVHLVNNQGGPASDWDMHSVKILCNEPVLDITKLVDKTTAYHDDIVTYTVEVRNTGTGRAEDVSVLDTIPTGLMYLDGSSNNLCNQQGNSVVCGTFDINAGGIRRLDLVFKVLDTAACSSIITNRVDVSATNASPKWATSPNTTIQCHNPNLDITKSGPSTVVAGENITYNIDVKNTGNGLATDVQVSDFFVNGAGHNRGPLFTFLSANGGTCSMNIHNELKCDIGTIALGHTKSISLTFRTPTNQFCDEIVMNQADAHISSQVNGAPSDWDKHQVTVECDEPELEVTKTVNKTTAYHDDIVTYTVLVENTGAGMAKDVSVLDAIPAGLLYLDGSSNNLCNQQGNTVICGPFNLNAGSDKSLNLVFRVLDTTACNAVITNRAEVSASNAASVWAISPNTTIQCHNPEFTAVKTVDKSSVEVGDRLTYEIEIENTGHVTLGGTWVIDTIPTGLTYNAGLSDSRCFTQGNDVKCGDDEIDAGDTDTYKLVFEVHSGAQCGSNIYNTAQLVFMDNNGLSGYTNQVQTYVNCADPEADLSISKTAPAQVFRGSTVEYTLRVNNHGSDTAQNVQIIDTIPDVKIQSSNSRTDLIFNSAQSDNACYVSGGNVICNIGTLQANQYDTVNIVFDIPSIAECSAAIINEAEVESSTHDPLLSNNDDSAASTVNCATTTIDVQKSGPTSVIRGNEIEYTIVATNNLGFNTTRNRVIDPVPDHLTFLRANNNICHYESQTDEVICGEFDLNAGASKTFKLTFKVEDTAPCDSTITNIADVWSNHPGVDPQWSNPVRTDVLCSDPILTITKTDNRTTAERGDRINYEITITNHSNFDAEDVEIIDALPRELTFVDANLGGNYESTTHTVLWDLDIAAGETVDLAIEARVNNDVENGDVLRNYVEITGGDNDTDTTTVVVKHPTFTIRKSDNRSTIEPGENNYYDITVTNTSNVDAENINIIDTLPQNVSFDFASSPLGVNDANLIGNTVVWITDLLAGESINVRLGVTVDNDAEDGDIIYNTVCVDQSPCDNDTTTVVENDPTFSITKTDFQSITKPGETLLYDIVVTNTSGTDADDVEIIDTLPSNVTFQDANLGGSHSNGEVTWIRDIDAGESVIFTVDVIVDSHAEDGDLIYNYVEITNGPDAADTTVVHVDDPIVGCIDVQKETYDYNGTKLSPVTQFTFFLNGSDDTVQNDSSGNARFTNVPVGTHTVTEDIPTGWTQQLVTPANGRVTVHEGNDCVTVTFKNQQDQFGTPNFTIDKTDNKTVAEPDETLNYVITVRNTGTADATNVVVTDNIPNDVDFLSADNSGVRNGNTVTWTFDLAAGSTKTLGMSVRVNNNADDGDTIRNTACVSGGPCDDDNTTIEVDDDDDDSNDDDVSISVNDDPDPIDVCNDDDLEYDIRLTNSSNSNKTVDVVASLDSNTEYRSSSDGGKERSGDRVEWDNIKVSRNSSRTLRVRVRVDSDARDGDTLRLRAAVSGGDEDTEITRVRNRDCGDDDDEDVPPSQPDLTIDKTADRTEALAGSFASYTITIRNTGNRDIQNATLTDDYPESMMTIADPGGGSDGGGELRWNLGTLRANSTTVVRYRVRIKDTVTQGSSIRNTATVRGEGLTRTDTHTIVVPRPPVTGLGGFIKGIAGTANLLTPSTEAANPVAPTTDPALPMTVWLTTIFMGLGFGGTFGRRFLF